MKRIITLVIILLLATMMTFSSCCKNPDVNIPEDGHSIYLRLNVFYDLMNNLHDEGRLNEDDYWIIARLWLDASSNYIHDNLEDASTLLKQASDLLNNIINGKP